MRVHSFSYSMAYNNDGVEIEAVFSTYTKLWFFKYKQVDFVKRAVNDIYVHKTRRPISCHMLFRRVPKQKGMKESGKKKILENNKNKF